MCRKVLLLLKCMIMFCIWSIRYKMGYRQPREIHYELTPATRHRQVSVFQLAFAIVVGTITLAAILLALCVIWYVGLSRNAAIANIQNFNSILKLGTVVLRVQIKLFGSIELRAHWYSSLQHLTCEYILVLWQIAEVDTIFCNFYLNSESVGSVPSVWNKPLDLNNTWSIEVRGRTWHLATWVYSVHLC